MSKETQIEIKAEIKETVSMTVVISKEAREKLRDVKGILGCKTLDGAVNAAMATISIKELLSVRLENEKLKESSLQVLSNGDQSSSTDEPIDINGSLYGKEENDMIAFCGGLIMKYQVSDIAELKSLIYDGVIEIINHQED